MSFLVNISVCKFVFNYKASWASDLVLGVKNAPKWSVYRETRGFWKLLLIMHGETSSSFFKKKGLGIFRNISIHVDAKLHFLLLRAVIRLDFLLKCSKGSSSCHSYTSALVYIMLKWLDLMLVFLIVKNCNPKKYAKYLHYGSCPKCIARGWL